MPCRRHAYSELGYMPTRLICVNEDLGAENVRVIVTEELNLKHDAKRPAYVALSHCWGEGGCSGICNHKD